MFHDERSLARVPGCSQAFQGSGDAQQPHIRAPTQQLAKRETTFVSFLNRPFQLPDWLSCLSMYLGTDACREAATCKLLKLTDATTPSLQDAILTPLPACLGGRLYFVQYKPKAFMKTS